jgi:phosphoribosylamine--glycine ligase
VAVVLAAEGYPDAPRRGAAIDGLDEARGHALVFHAGTERGPDGGFRTAGGRVLTVVGRSADVDDARRQAYAAADAIRFAGAQVRRDIGYTVAHERSLVEAVA